MPRWHFSDKLFNLQLFSISLSLYLCVCIFDEQDEVLAISERVVIRADDLLNWCDDTINWTYGLRANALLDPTIKEELTEKSDDNTNNAPNKTESDASIDEITSKNVRSLKNSKLDFAEVEKEKGMLQ